METRFRDRKHAGQLLAKKLAGFRKAKDTLVLALPRGGVVLAFEIAEELELPLDVCIVRKLGVPWQPELAMGAVASGGVVVLHHATIAELGVPKAAVDRELADEQNELERREMEYRGHRPLPDLSGKTVILVDDGIATGATVEAAIEALHQQQVRRIVLAVGVAPPSTMRRLAAMAGEAVAVMEIEWMGSIGEWFEDFTQVTDSEVRDLLDRSSRLQQKQQQPAA